MPEEPDAPHARRRARAQLSVPRPQAVLRPCGTAGGRDRVAPARSLMKRIACIALAWLFVVAATCAAQLLPSWNDGSTKEAIVRFVTDVTTPGTSTFVAPENRIAVFDNDGTLWAEQPAPAQFAFALDRVKALA